MEERNNVWDIAKVCRNPFNLKARVHSTTDEEAVTHTEDEEIGRAFIKHKIIKEGDAEEEEQLPQRKEPAESGENTDTSKEVQEQKCPRPRQLAAEDGQSHGGGREVTNEIATWSDPARRTRTRQKRGTSRW